MRFRSPPKGRVLVSWKQGWKDSLDTVRNSEVCFDIEGILEIIKCILLIPAIYLMSAIVFPVVLAKGYYACYRYCFYKLTEEEEMFTQKFLSKYSRNT